MEKDDIPKSLRLVMVFIDRVGFPVTAFLLMFAMTAFVMVKMNKTFEENTVVLRRISSELGEHSNFAREAVRVMTGNKTYREIEEEARARK